MSNVDVQTKLANFVIHAFLTEEESSDLTNDTPLIDIGIVDSIGMLRLIAYLEDEFEIVIQGIDANKANFNTINAIALLVSAKKCTQGF